MREIKFRQPILEKDGTLKFWHYWGFFDEKWNGPETHYSTIKSAKERSQQFTGLKDKNG